MTDLQIKELRVLIETAIDRALTTIIQSGTTWDAVVFERGRLEALNRSNTGWGAWT